MILKRTYLGLEIQNRELRAVTVRRQGKGIQAVAANRFDMPADWLRPGFSSPNISAPEQFVAALKQLLETLAGRDKRIAVALPDQTGSLLLLELETPFKNRREGLDIIRWQLKDQLPGKNRLALDYQILEEQESGAKKVLVAALSQDVLEHYEALIEQAGYAATAIDFHSSALYSAYRAKIDFGRDFVLVGMDGGQLTMLVVCNQIPVFYRGRHVDHDPQRLFQELNRSLVACRKEQTHLSRLPVYLHLDPDDEEIAVVIRAAFDREINLLQPPLVLPAGQWPADRAGSLAAALGMAERLIPRMV